MHLTLCLQLLNIDNVLYNSTSSLAPYLLKSNETKKELWVGNVFFGSKWIILCLNSRFTFWTQHYPQWSFNLSNILLCVSLVICGWLWRSVVGGYPGIGKWVSQFIGGSFPSLSRFLQHDGGPRDAVLFLPEPSFFQDSYLVPLPNGTFCFCLWKDSSLPFGCISLAIEHLFSRAGVWRAYKLTYLSEVAMVVQMPKMSACLFTYPASWS